MSTVHPANAVKGDGDGRRARGDTIYMERCVLGAQGAKRGVHHAGCE